MRSFFAGILVLSFLSKLSIGSHQNLYDEGRTRLLLA